jgi:hypothetical protein
MSADKELTTRFIADLDEIATDFIRSFGLKHTSEIGHLSEPLLRWLDFRLRYVDPKPRQIYLSQAFPKNMSDTTKKALEHIMKMIQAGDDINPYQGKGLILYHDSSGSKKQNRTDLLWADWGIIHFHLTTEPLMHGQYFSERSCWLLFALVGEDFCALIDIRHHDEENLFANSELIEMVVKSWPELMERYELKGVIAPDVSISSEDRAKLRKSGVSSMIAIGDKVYMGPGMGVTSATTPMRVSLTMDNVRSYARQFARVVSTPDSEFQSDVRINKAEEPEFELCLTPKGMAVYEATLDKAWLLPKKVSASGFHYLAELNELVAPEWAIKQLSFPGLPDK